MRATINGWLRRLPVWAVWLAGLVPLALLLADAVNGTLGADPVALIEHRLGRTALYLLVGGLAITPLLKWGRINMMRFRRAVGLLAFTYVMLHVMTWLLLDLGLIAAFAGAMDVAFVWGQAVGDIIKRPYLTVGMFALALLIPLAVTSNQASIRAMGGKAWRKLHRLVYLAVPAAAVHYLMVAKVIRVEAVVWLALALALLALRLVRPPQQAQPAVARPAVAPVAVSRSAADAEVRAGE